MPKKGLYTVKKNIERESAHYLLKHQTPALIRLLAEADERTVGTFLDRLIEQEAFRVLPHEVVERVIEEGKQTEAERIAQAENLLQQQEAGAS